MIMLLHQFVSTGFSQQQKAEEVCYNPNAKGDTSKRSIKSAAVKKIGAASVAINYHSPGVRGRTIFFTAALLRLLLLVSPFALGL